MAFCPRLPVTLKTLRYRICSASVAQNLFSTKVENSRRRLVILGTGWSSYAVLKNINKSLYDVIVVSPRNHFLFTPLLCSTTVGTLEFRSIIEPVRNTVFRSSDHFHLSYATAVEIKDKKLFVTSMLDQTHSYSLDFDQLVIGVGALSNTFGVPGVIDNAYFLKEISDARRIRNRLLSNFELALQPGLAGRERARLLHTVIVGGGPTGVEFGAELYDFVQQDVKRLYAGSQEDVRVTLIEASQILNSFDPKLQAFAEKKIRERSRFSLLQDSVTEVRAESVTLSSGEEIPCGLVVWSTGLSPRTFVKNLDVAKNQAGQILTDRKLQVQDSPDNTVFAVGDCADIVDYKLPCTAQVAERQGRYLAQSLNRSAQGHSTRPFTFSSMGMLAYIGSYQGLTDLPEAKLKGFPSWLLWRSAYLTRLGSWRLRMQVPMDWMKTLIFGRDISRFE